jgi:hypothetical protein
MAPEIGDPDERWEVTPTHEPVQIPDAPYYEPTTPVKVPERVP